MTKIPKGADLTRTKTKFAPIISSSRAANIIFRYWDRRYNHIPDAVVVEGPLAGGHLGFKKSTLQKSK